MGKKLSIRISWTVMSCGVPSVAMVVKTRSDISAFRRWIGSKGRGASSKAAEWDSSRNPS